MLPAHTDLGHRTGLNANGIGDPDIEPMTIGNAPTAHPVARRPIRYRPIRG